MHVHRGLSMAEGAGLLGLAIPLALPWACAATFCDRPHVADHPQRF